MNIPETILVNLRSKLRFKAQYHLGPWCPDVEDVVQETLIRLLRAAQDEMDRSVETWVAFANSTCNNVIHEYRRKLWRDAGAEPSLQEPRSASGFAALEARDLVDETLAQLSAKDQQILRAFYLEEKTIDEVCAESGVNRAHFGVALFRAKAKFRKRLSCDTKSADAGSH